MKLYLLAGPAETKLTGTAGDNSASAKDEDITAGVGLQFEVREDYYFLVDYIKYFDSDKFDQFTGDISSAAINIGVGGYF